MIIRTISVMALLVASHAHAAPIEFTTGITTGAFIFHSQTLQFQDGAPITEFPIWLFLEHTRPYGAQLVPVGSPDKNESFAAVAGNRQLGFASAVSTGDGVIEVGAVNGLRAAGTHLAFSRYYSTIKNNTDLELNFNFDFEVQPGEATIYGIRDGDTAHLRAGAFIDYSLLSPSGPFGGTYAETTGRLFDYFIDIDFDDTFTASANASPLLLVRNSFELAYASGRYTNSVRLPVIPARGELTIYYDMYAHLNIMDAEVGGVVRLGDPTDLVGGQGVRLIEVTQSAVPEPGSLLLLAGGFAALLGLVIRRRAGALDELRQPRRFLV